MTRSTNPLINLLNIMFKSKTTRQNKIVIIITMFMSKLFNKLSSSSSSSCVRHKLLYKLSPSSYVYALYALHIQQTSCQHNSRIQNDVVSLLNYSHTRQIVLAIALLLVSHHTVNGRPTLRRIHFPIAQQQNTVHTNASMYVKRSMVLNDP